MILLIIIIVRRILSHSFCLSCSGEAWVGLLSFCVTYHITVLSDWEARDFYSGCHTVRKGCSPKMTVLCSALPCCLVY